MKSTGSFKKIISILLALLIVVMSFSACGAKKDASEADADAKSGGSGASQGTSDTVKSTDTGSTQQTTTEKQQPGKRDLSAFKGKKLIAITFDDGPAGADSTGKLLDNLDKYNARVTFFVVGDRVAEYSSMLKREYEMGNQIASHSYAHKNLTKLSEAEIKEDLTKTNEAIKSVIGVEPTCMRPPYGSINDTVKKAAGAHIITWSIDTLDWKHKNAQKACDNIVNNAFDGAIALLHDLYPTSVEGALMAMEILKDKGYAFVTIEEMAELRGIQMDYTKVYNNFKPAEEQTTTTTAAKTSQAA